MFPLPNSIDYAPGPRNDQKTYRATIGSYDEPAEAAEVAAFAEENKKKLLAMEAAKWEEGYDAYEERYFYTHSETGEVVWDEKPLDREFVLRVKWETEKYSLASQRCVYLGRHKITVVFKIIVVSLPL